MTDLRREAEAHIRSYQARLDLDGWSDDICVEICETFATAQRLKEVEATIILYKKYILDNTTDEDFTYWLTQRCKELTP